MIEVTFQTPFLFFLLSLPTLLFSGLGAQPGPLLVTRRGEKSTNYWGGAISKYWSACAGQLGAMEDFQMWVKDSVRMWHHWELGVKRTRTMYP